MTTKITQDDFTTVTEGQYTHMKRFLEDGIRGIDLSALGLTRETAQEIIENGDLLKSEMQTSLIQLLKKLSIADKRFGVAIKEFEVTVPMDYKHDEQIDTFGKKTKKLKNTYYYNDAFTSKNFAQATNKLEPGKTYTVKIFPILDTVTSIDCMNFLKKQNAILVGGQGLSLAQDLKKEEFPEGKWTVSFDEKEALWKDSVGNHGVPRVRRFSDGDWGFDLGLFEGAWGADYCLLCFCDKKPLEA